MQFVDHQVEVKFRDLLWCLVIFFIAGFLWGKCLTNRDSYLYECLGVNFEPASTYNVNRLSQGGVTSLDVRLEDGYEVRTACLCVDDEPSR